MLTAWKVVRLPPAICGIPVLSECLPDGGVSSCPKLRWDDDGNEVSDRYLDGTRVDVVSCEWDEFVRGTYESGGRVFRRWR